MADPLKCVLHWEELEQGVVQGLVQGVTQQCPEVPGRLCNRLGTGGWYKG
jgi:hypothetical protein